MKFGIRKPSPRKMLAARMSIKRQIVNRAGLKMPRGYGWVTNPKRYIYNKIYKRTTVSFWSLFK
ncbi:MAG: hypothetical protein QM529_00150 [Hydrotalea sp.]|nr:hypothetical protein [Hydrotalea sp.]